MKSKQLSIHPEFEDLRRQFAAWRKTRKHRDRTPEELWRLAADLARRHGVNPIAKALGLDYHNLKRRVICPTHTANNGATRTPTFIELPGLVPPVAPSSCTAELSNAAGSKMTVRWTGAAGADLAALAEAFWSQRS
jgi:hypothetical protein